MRALSSAVNDPATAVDALDAIDGLLRSVGDSDLRAAAFTDGQGALRVRVDMPGWEDFLRTGIEDLLPTAAASSLVRRRLLVMYDDLVLATPPDRHPAIGRLRQKTVVST
jgi:uncharacterized membrane protein